MRTHTGLNKAEHDLRQQADAAVQHTPAEAIKAKPDLHGDRVDNGLVAREAIIEQPPSKA